MPTSTNPCGSDEVTDMEYDDDENEFLIERKYDELVARTTHLIDPYTDSLRIYLLANHTSVRSWGIGDRHVEDVIIF